MPSTVFIPIFNTLRDLRSHRHRSDEYAEIPSRNQDTLVQRHCHKLNRSGKQMLRSARFRAPSQFNAMQNEEAKKVSP